MDLSCVFTFLIICKFSAFLFHGAYHGNHSRDISLRIHDSQKNKVTNFLMSLKYKQVQVGNIVTSEKA